MNPTFEQLKSVFTYDADSGIVSSNRKPAGYVMKSGYHLLSYKEKRLYAHRVAWCLITGDWPTKEIDHINGVKNDNRFLNLREATRRENSRNQSITSKNTSGFKGVSFHKRTGKWRADIQLNGSQKSLGSFYSREEAFEVYKKASIENFGEFSKL